jgi:hypothetical protein
MSELHVMSRARDDDAEPVLLERLLDLWWSSTCTADRPNECSSP